MQQGNPIAYISKSLAPRHQAMHGRKIRLLMICQEIKVLKLLAISLLTPNDTLLERSSLTWTADAELQAVIVKLQARPINSIYLDWFSAKVGRQGSSRKCDICQSHKYDAAAYPGLLQPLPIPNGVWIDISLDFIEGLSKSKGKDVILVVVDRLCKSGHFIAIAHPYTADSVAQCFLDNVFKLHGMTTPIISDMDLTF
uniref:Integrase catalytic domain-containing protein n=1 Tax=Solanum lycopersicum TaxID=4081 RepID=A0A3Q7GK67_SOLLC